VNLGIKHFWDPVFLRPKDLESLRNTLSHGTKSTLPLTKESVPHNTQLVSEMDMLAPWERLRENVFYLLVRGNILKFHNSLLDPISDEMILDPNVFGPVMEYRILWEFNTTLIIALYYRRTQLRIKQATQNLTKPNGLACSLASRNILSFS